MIGEESKIEKAEPAKEITPTPEAKEEKFDMGESEKRVEEYQKTRQELEKESRKKDLEYFEEVKQKYPIEPEVMERTEEYLKKEKYEVGERVDSFRKKTTDGIFRREHEIGAEFFEGNIKKWKEGAESFHKFWQQIGKPEEYSQSATGPLQGMFLGEKPACFIEPLCLKYKDELESFGFKIIGDYTYSPELVAEVMQKYKAEFDKYQLKTPEQTMETLAQSKKDEFDVIRGLVLGIPLESAKRFEYVRALRINKIAEKLYDLLKEKPKEQKHLELTYFTKQSGNYDLIPFLRDKLIEYQGKLGLDDYEIPRLLDELRYQINSKGVDIYGIQWSDYGYSEQSEKEQKRLKAAFEKSGILE